MKLITTLLIILAIAAPVSATEFTPPNTGIPDRTEAGGGR